MRKGDELSRCVEEVRALKDELRLVREENQHLRAAAETFGALADRLNAALRQERRGGSQPQ